MGMTINNFSSYSCITLGAVKLYILECEYIIFVYIKLLGILTIAAKSFIKKSVVIFKQWMGVMNAYYTITFLNIAVIL